MSRTPRRPSSRTPTNRRGHPALSTRRLNELVEDAITDAHDESEQVVGFLCMLEEHLALPFSTEVLGAAVRVERVETNDADEIVYLEHYFGQRPDEYQRARFFLMRQMVHIFYAAVFLLLSSAGKPIDLSEKLPSYRDFYRRIWASEVNLADNDLKIVYGRVHWEQFLQKMQQTRFAEALRIVSDRHACLEGMSRLLPLAQ